MTRAIVKKVFKILILSRKYLSLNVNRIASNLQTAVFAPFGHHFSLTLEEQESGLNLYLNF
jgi:hypothetical protein